MERMIILRHGETEYNRNNKLQGKCNSGLTEKGKAQARNIGRRLKKLLPGKCAVFSSTLGRARETAEIVCAEIGCDAGRIVFDERLEEFHLGEWEKGDIAEIRKGNPDIRDRKDWYLHAPRAESFESVKTRIESWLADVEDIDGDVVVVTHGLTGSVLRGVLTGIDYDSIWLQDISQDSFYVFEDDRLERIRAETDAEFT